MSIVSAIRNRRTGADAKRRAELWAEYGQLLERNRDGDAEQLVVVATALKMPEQAESLGCPLDDLVELHRVALEHDADCSARVARYAELQPKAVAAEKAYTESCNDLLRAKRRVEEAHEAMHQANGLAAAVSTAGTERDSLRAYFPDLLGEPTVRVRPSSPGGRTQQAATGLGIKLPPVPLSSEQRDTRKRAADEQSLASEPPRC